MGSARPSAEAISSNDAVLPARTASIQLRDRAIACSSVSCVLPVLCRRMRDPFPGKKSWSEGDHQVRCGTHPCLSVRLVSSRFCATLSDRDLIGVDHDRFDTLADKFVVQDATVSLSCLLIGSPRLL
jgi:hypothetical protein